VLPSVSGRNMQHVASSTYEYDEAVCVNTAVEINVLEYNVNVGHCMQCERDLNLT